MYRYQDGKPEIPLLIKRIVHQLAFNKLVVLYCSCLSIGTLLSKLHGQ